MNLSFEIRKSDINGLGCFALKDIPKGSEFISNVVLILKDYKGNIDHLFGFNETYWCLSVGPFCFLNNGNGDEINTFIKVNSVDEENKTMTFVTTQDIKEGQEILL